MTTTAPMPSSTFSRVGGGLMRLAEALATPIVPADYLDLVAPMRAGADLRGRVVSVDHETPDAATVTIRPSRGWRGHTPGQYVRIGVDVDGVRNWRAYSLTHASDRTDGLISITVKAIEDGKVSQYIVHRLRPGTMILLDQATGEFTLPPARPDKVLFLTAGSGITPVMGMLRAVEPAAADVVMIHCDMTPDDVIFRRDLHAQRDAGRLRLIERHTDVDGFLAGADLDDLVPDWREREAWVCGPTGLLDLIEEHYAAEGIADQLHTERFRPTIIATGDGGAVALSAPGAESATVVEADGATPILDAAEDAGLIMPSGCRMGICFGCQVPLTEGAVRDLRNGELTTTTRDDPAVLIQTCVSAAAGPCAISLPA